MVNRVPLKSAGRVSPGAIPGIRRNTYSGHGPGDYPVEGQRVIVDTPEYLQLSGSAQGWVPPVLFGARALTGQLILAYTPDDGKTLYFAWAIAEAPLTSLSNLTLSGIPVSDLSYVVDSETHLGAYDQAASAILAGAISGHVEAWPGLAYVVLKIDGSSADLASLTLTADCVGGDLFDFRTSSQAQSANPILEAYEILSDEELWLGPLRYPIDVGSWTAAADWCDDSMSDGSARFECHIAVDPSKPESALETILSHAHARLVVADGKYFLAQDRALTPRDIHVAAGDWVGGARVEELPRQSRPNVVAVRYARDGSPSPTVMAETGAIAAGAQPIQLQAVLAGIKSSTMAYRWAAQRLNVLNQETITVRGRVIATKVADVVPSDAIYVSTATGIIDRPARVEAIRDLGDGSMELRARILSDAVDAPITLGEDPNASPGSLWSTGAPDPPTGLTASVEYGEVGDGVGAARIAVSWTAPTAGVAVDHYEVEAAGVLVATTVNTNARFHTNNTGYVSLSIYAVSPSGVRSTALSGSVTVIPSSARVTKVQGVALSSSAPGDLDRLMYDGDNGAWGFNPYEEWGQRYIMVFNDGDSQASGTTPTGAGWEIVSATYYIELGDDFTFSPLYISNDGSRLYRDGTSGKVHVSVVWHKFTASRPVTLG